MDSFVQAHRSFKSHSIKSECENNKSSVCSRVKEVSNVLLDRMINLNIGGRTWTIKSVNLINKEWAPGTRLYNLVQGSLTEAQSNHSRHPVHCDHYDPVLDEYYFDRPPSELQIVADFHFIGCAHQPADMCFQRFQNLLEYWAIPQQLHFPICCSQNVPRKQTEFSLSVLDNNPSDSIGTAICPNMPTQKQSVFSHELLPIDQFELVKYGRFRSTIWNILEDPQSSSAAKITSFLSMSFILASVTGLILGSIREFQLPCPEKLEEEDLACDPKPIVVLEFVEYACIGWFTVEFVLRLLVCVNRIHFLLQPLNLIDLATILPFYAEMCLPLVGVRAESLRRVAAAMLVIRILRVLRVARIFKLARYSSGLQTVGKTFYTSVRELSMLLMFMLTAIVFFSTILYFVERDEKGTDFVNIPASCWWCVVTMTTVGYGDMVPKTPVGKLFATIASVSGIIVLAFPISMIVERFATVQEEQRVEALGASGDKEQESAGRADGGMIYAGKFGGGRRRRRRTLLMMKEQQQSAQGLIARKYSFIGENDPGSEVVSKASS